MIFSNENIDKLYLHVDSIGGKILDETVSLCHDSYYHIPALRYEKDGKVYIAKNSPTIGITDHMIESDSDFYSKLVCEKDQHLETFTNPFHFDNFCLTEVTDRCNLTCPHCYHLPDNKIKDVSVSDIVIRMQNMYAKGITRVMLSGAEVTMRNDLPKLITEILKVNPDFSPKALTNGIRFCDEDFLKRCVDAGMTGVCLGLNNEDYIGNEKVRDKQLQAIENCMKYDVLEYIGYTMIDLNELDGILEEILTKGWKTKHYRIRCGSEIGRNESEDRVFVSDIYKYIKQYCETNNIDFEDVPADNNIYHTMIKVNGNLIRVIQWCDITDIDMEELRSGPFCDFVPQDGLTNFLHQIIRRDVWKNQGKQLPDLPPKRYQAPVSKEPLDLYKLKETIIVRRV